MSCSCQTDPPTYNKDKLLVKDKEQTTQKRWHWRVTKSKEILEGSWHL